jgi:hypothetical protein
MRPPKDGAGDKGNLSYKICYDDTLLNILRTCYDSEQLELLQLSLAKCAVARS